MKILKKWDFCHGLAEKLILFGELESWDVQLNFQSDQKPSIL